MFSGTRDIFCDTLCGPLPVRGHADRVLRCSSPGGGKIISAAANRLIGEVCTITEKALTRAFSWLKAPTSAFTFKTLLRHYAERALTPR